MTEEEARKLLPQHADGLLPPEQAGEVEAALAASPQLQTEYRKLKEENELLTEALAPLRPSHSARLRAVEAMQLVATDMHRRAQHVAETLPARGWLIFRLGFAIVALLLATGWSRMHPATALMADEVRLGHYVLLGLFAIGITLVVAGNILAQIEAYLMSLLSPREVKPSRLEILTLEVFGILSVLAAGIMALWK